MSRRLSVRLRQLIAGSQVVGGAIVMLLTVFTRGLPLWYNLVLEGLGVLSIAAGVLLWRDDQRGYRYSRLLQALQVVRIHSPAFMYVVTLGLHLDLWVGGNAIRISPGIHGELGLLFGTGMPFRIGINFVSAAWFLVLAGARPAVPSPHSTAIPSPGVED